PQLFQTRWTMNFLAGPLTRTQIKDLNQHVDANVRPAPVVPLASGILPRAAVKVDSSVTKPPIPAWIREYFLPQNYSLPEAFSAAGRSMPAEVMIDGVIYQPALLASAQVRILDRKHGVESEITRSALLKSPEKRGSVRWEDYPLGGNVLDNIGTSPMPSARFSTIDSPLNDVKLMTALQKDFTDWVFRNSSVKARANQALKVFAGPDVSQAEFMKACAEAAREARDAEVAKKTAQVDRQLKTLEDKLAREERELRQDEDDLQNRKLESGANLLELGASFMGIGRKKSVTSQLSKHRLSQNAKAEVEESHDAIAQFKQQIADLEKRREETIAEINDRWGRAVNETTEVTITPKKTDVFVNLFGVAWIPHYIAQTGADTIELPAFGAQ
ncbi:MAG: hypothetical protein ACXW4M_14245, partial [Anaerolineales bacterium]